MIQKINFKLSLVSAGVVLAAVFVALSVPIFFSSAQPATCTSAVINSFSVSANPVAPGEEVTVSWDIDFSPEMGNCVVHIENLSGQETFYDFEGGDSGSEVRSYSDNANLMLGAYDINNNLIAYQSIDLKVGSVDISCQDQEGVTSTSSCAVSDDGFFSLIWYEGDNETLCNFSSSNGTSSGVYCEFNEDGYYTSSHPDFPEPGETVTFRLATDDGIYDEVLVTNIGGLDPETATVDINASSCAAADWSLSEDFNGDENNGTGSQSDILVAVDGQSGTYFTLIVNSPAGTPVTNSKGGGATMTVYPNDPNATFSINCPPPSAPTITYFTVNGEEADIGLTPPAPLTLAWESENADSCQFTSPFTSAVALSDSVTYNSGDANHPFPTVKSYTLRCANTSSSAEVTRTVAAQVARISVTSNVGTGWTINPGGMTAVGLSGSHQVYPPPGGTTYTISGDLVAGYNPPTYTNSLTGAGNSMLIFPGDDESFAMNYTPVDNPPTTGSISAEDCGIPEGESTCNATVSWSLSNPVPGAPTEVTHDNPPNTLVSTSTSGTNVASTVEYGATQFFLYHDGAEMSNASMEASCANGTSWNSAWCESEEPPPPMSGTLTRAAPACVIASGASFCNINFSWSTINPESTSVVTKPVNVTVATGNSGSNVPFVVKYSSESFYLYNNGQELDSETVTSSCASGTAWNGSVCAPSSEMTGVLNAYNPSCYISAGQSSCNITFSWSVTNPTGATKVVRAGGSTVGSGHTGLQAFSVPFNSTTFLLINDTVELDSETVFSSCASGTGINWNGSACVAGPPPSISVELTATPSSMRLPDSATTLSWTTVGSPSSCSASGAWSGAKSPSGGSENKTGLLPGIYTYDIVCSKSGTPDVFGRAVVRVTGRQPEVKEN